MYKFTYPSTEINDDWVLVLNDIDTCTTPYDDLTITSDTVLCPGYL